MHYLGVDMAVKKHDLCLMADDGRVLSECSVSNSHERFEELRRLRREVERLREERDILKKAVSIFSQEKK